jgi:TatA/E family protein of Tat protein translocase
MGPLGWQETIAIFLVALLIFGPRKLPELGKNIGKAISQFKRASTDLKATWDREMSAIQEEGEALKKEAKKAYFDESEDYESEDYYDSSYEDPYNTEEDRISDTPTEKTGKASESKPESSKTAESDTPKAKDSDAAKSSGSTRAEASVPSKRPAPEGTVAQGSDLETESAAQPAEKKAV